MTASAIDRVLSAIRTERSRQVLLRDLGKFRHTVACDGITDGFRLAVLVEEVGEVATELQSQTPDISRLRDELVQVAAVACAWVEHLDRR